MFMTGVLVMQKLCLEVKKIVSTRSFVPVSGHSRAYGPVSRLYRNRPLPHAVRCPGVNTWPRCTLTPGKYPEYLLEARQIALLSKDAVELDILKAGAKA